MTQFAEPPAAPEPALDDEGSESTEAQAPAGAAAPAEPSSRELSAAEAELARADAELQAFAQLTVPASESAAEPAPSDRPSSARAAPKRRAAAAPDCATACKAFASLSRARDSICRIEGADGARCAHANGLVEKHAGIVQTCGCRQ